MTTENFGNDFDPTKFICLAGATAIFGPAFGPFIGIGLNHFIKNVNS